MFLVWTCQLVWLCCFLPTPHVCMFFDLYKLEYILTYLSYLHFILSPYRVFPNVYIYTYLYIIWFIYIYILYSVHVYEVHCFVFVLLLSFCFGHHVKILSQQTLPFSVPRKVRSREEAQVLRAQLEQVCLYTWHPNDPCSAWKRPCFGGLTFKHSAHLGSRYMLFFLSEVKKAVHLIPRWLEDNEDNCFLLKMAKLSRWVLLSFLECRTNRNSNLGYA